MSVVFNKNSDSVINSEGYGRSSTNLSDKVRFVKPQSLHCFVEPPTTLEFNLIIGLSYSKPPKYHALGHPVQNDSIFISFPFSA